MIKQMERMEITMEEKKLQDVKAQETAEDKKRLEEQETIEDTQQEDLSGGNMIKNAGLR